MFSNIKTIYHNVHQISSSLSDFLSTNEESASKQLDTCKRLYDLAREFERDVPEDYLDQLLLEGFEAEQVWQQIDLVNKHWQKNLNKHIKEVKKDAKNESGGKKVKVLGESNFLEEDDEDEGVEGDDDDDDEEENGQGDDDDVDSEDENLKRILLKLEDGEQKLMDGEDEAEDGGELGDDDDDKDEYDTDLKDNIKSKKVKFADDVMFKDDDDEEDDEEDDGKKKDESKTKVDEHYAMNMLKKNLKNTGKRSKSVNRREVVDDTFFKLNQMEEFLEQQDAKEQRKIDGEDEDENEDGDDDDDDIDVFQDFSDDDDDDEEAGGGDDDDGDEKKGTIKFNDFFDRPDGVDDDDDDDDDEKMDVGDVGDDDDDDDDEEDDEDDDEEEDGGDDESILHSTDKKTEGGKDGDDGDGGGGGKSRFERNQEILKRKIKHLEDGLVAEKGWQLRGEVEAVVRPVNSLLSEALEHETNVKEAPIITEEVTRSIEDKILQRLKDNIWDGPCRKVKVMESAFDLEMKKRKKMVIDEEKHKLSLAEQYEQEYLEKNKVKEERLPEAMEAIKRSMEVLFAKLDALSNYHFTPKPPVAESEIVTYLPSIAMEEAAPVVHSEASVLAPQEIMGKNKRGLVGESEKTDTDKKRMRRVKKKQQHLKRVKVEEIDKIKKVKTAKSDAKFKSKTDAYLEFKKKPLKEKGKKGKKY